MLVLNREEPFRQAVDEALSGKRSQQMLHLNGRYCKLLANPVLADGKPAGAVLVLLDVTEQEQRDELRREFTANVSHELKTPLTSISGIAEIMQSGMVKPEDIQSFAGDIYQEAQRLIALVEDIIRLSRLDEGAESLEREPVNLLSVAPGRGPAAGLRRPEGRSHSEGDGPVGGGARHPQRAGRDGVQPV